ncbi:MULTISPECIES: aldo/keto reductase [unclassified Microbulbifer]|uniref:aldo/keto reductase n=1 Tax=unclassified Microbulbifer TaxID=2619833 RepID=UPI0027E5667C|nr:MULTISPECIES: aldo/keto reductase [unclassified Microbulbifer]
MQRRIADWQGPAIGLGCMNLSHAYGTPPAPADAAELLLRAHELGVRHFDTAALYGFGRNEELVGKVLKPLRGEIFLASKCGMTGVDGKRVIDGRPETLTATLEEALRRLQTDHIDLYYLHRWDKSVPIEDSVGTMARMVEQGKIGAIGLSEVSADTLRKAHSVHPIAAVQTEYSLWTRNPEIALLDTCRELGAALVAFSPLARGFLAGSVTDPEALEPGDIRRNMPRFQSPHFALNCRLRDDFRELAAEAGCTMSQLALCWLLEQDPCVIPIPGTRSLAHLEENLAAASVGVSEDILVKASQLIGPNTVSGPRYGAATQAEIDTEDYV